MAADRLVAAIARAQHGTITYEQLLAAGLTPSAVKHRVRAGRLHRLYRGVYAVGHLALPPLGRVTAAVLACGPGAAASHASAAAIWGLCAAPPAVHVSVPPGRHPAHARIVVHRPAALADGDIRVHEGLRVTSVARTLADLSARSDLERLVAESFARRLVRPQELRERSARLRIVVDEAPRLTRSEAERRFLVLMRRARREAPETNVRVAGLEVDFLWRRERFVVEVDGFAFHGHRSAFERDRRREQILRGAGHELARVTWRQIEREPEALVADVAATLTRRAPR